MKSQATTVEAYFSEVPEKRLAALTHLRELCQKHLPDHVEDMTYNMPSYSANGQVEVAYACQKQHISVYFLVHSVMLDHADRLEGINHGKGCLRFGNPNKIDFTLIANLLDATRDAEEQICK